MAYGGHRDSRVAVRNVHIRTAAQGDPQALYNLGHLHAFGDGVAADPVEAERLYRLAAARGHPEALEAQGGSGSS